MADNTNGRGFASMDEDKQKDIASQGGQASTRKFGSENGADPKEEGAKGAEAQPREAKVEGGQKGGQKDQSQGNDDENES